MDIIFSAAGGLALFLFAMVMMTDGLKIFIGTKLKNILQRWTSSTLRGVISGALVTGIVQSSSAVTVATIGFINAGVFTLRQALGVIFGSNVGTTMTGWIVSSVGFGLKIEALAMPILAIGVALHFLAPHKKYKALGDTLIGFGLFFLALALLKDSFSGVADAFGTGLLTSTNIGGLFFFIFAGFTLTVLTQSSSAAIAVILMAVSESVLGVNAAAAAIIGANVGTTSTAVIAALNATPNAKRLAAGHVAFNIITGLVAISILPGLIWMTSEFGHLVGIGNNTLPFLALFHTIFNIFGVLIMLPFTGELVTFLDKRFKTEEEDLSRPQYLDKTVSVTPALAVSALWQEIQRLNELTCSIVLSVLRSSRTRPRTIEKKSEAVFSLGRSVHEFVTTVRMEDMSRDISEELPKIIRVTRYLENVAEFLPETNILVNEAEKIKGTGNKVLLKQFVNCVENAVVLFIDKEEHHDKVVLAMDKCQSAYQELKEGLLRAAVSKKVSPEKTDELLDRVSHARRLVEQMSKADYILSQYPKDAVVTE